MGLLQYLQRLQLVALQMEKHLLLGCMGEEVAKIHERDLDQNEHLGDMKLQYQMERQQLLHQHR